MPIIELGESNYSGPIPDDTMLPARVVAVNQKKAPFQDKVTGEDVWKMEFQFVIEDANSEHDGTRIWGETSTNFVNHPECKLKSWVQEILQTELVPPLSLDTDDLAGNRCRAIIGLREYEKDGKTVQRNFVRDVVRSATPSTLTPPTNAPVYADEEPF